jgi:hypothetical protein
MSSILTKQKKEEIKKMMDDFENGNLKGEERAAEYARIEAELDSLRCKNESESPWWYWFRIEVPPKTKRFDFFMVILLIILLENSLGLIIGLILRSIFGWPF